MRRFLINASGAIAILFVCVIAYAITRNWDQNTTSTIEITFIDGNSEVRTVTYTKIRLNESGCVQIATQDNFRYESIVCGVRKFEILK